MQPYATHTALCLLNVVSANCGVCKMQKLQREIMLRQMFSMQLSHVGCHVHCVDAPILALGETFSSKVQVRWKKLGDGEFNLLGLFVFLPAFHRSGVFLPCTWLCVSDPVCPVFVCLPLFPVVSRCFHSSPFV